MTLCVQWPRFGPYHLARLEAAQRVLGPRGVEVVGLEVASEDVLYDWAVERGPVGFRREQVFEGRAYERIGPREMAAGVTAALERLDPAAVAITSYSHPDARACLAWCRRRRRPAVLMIDTTEADAPRVGWREAVKRVLVAQYDAALVSGSPQRRYLETLGFPGAFIFRGYNAVDNAFFRTRAEAVRTAPEAAARLPGLADPTPFFLASGRFVPRKNVDGLVRAYGAYRRAAEAGGASPWRLVVLGDGPERARVEALAHEAGGVTLAGFQQAERLPAYYALAGAFVLPSLVDQWGLVVNEAMAAGLPVLVSRRAGCAEDLVREGETGFGFDPADEPALARLLARVAGLSAADRAAMGRQAQAHIEGWSPEAFAEGLWQAAEAGRSRADRPASPAARVLLGALALAQREPNSFHVIRD